MEGGHWGRRCGESRWWFLMVIVVDRERLYGRLGGSSQWEPLSLGRRFVESLNDGLTGIVSISESPCGALRGGSYWESFPLWKRFAGGSVEAHNENRFH